MKMERSVEFISPISMFKYTGSSGPTDEKIDHISSLCAWHSGRKLYPWREVGVIVTAILTGAPHILGQCASTLSAWISPYIKLDNLYWLYRFCNYYVCIQVFPEYQHMALHPSFPLFQLCQLDVSRSWGLGNPDLSFLNWSVVLIDQLGALTVSVWGGVFKGGSGGCSLP